MMAYFLGVGVSVFVLSRCGKPLMLCREKHTRKLLAWGRARAHPTVLLAIRLGSRIADVCAFQALRIKPHAGSFNIQTGSDVVQDIAHKHCRIIQRSSGYNHSRIATLKGVARSGHARCATLSLPALKGEASRETR